jgi:tetratricopeptide (TPR) repeat protein
MGKHSHFMLTVLPLLTGFIYLHAQNADSQRRSSVNLSVELNKAFTVYHNEPVIFTTVLVNHTLQENLQWNQAADDGLAKISADYKAGMLSKEEFETETERILKGKREIKADTIGSYGSPWFEQLEFRAFQNDSIVQPAWPITLLGDPLTDSIALLDEKGYYVVNHHLSPEQVAGLRPGTYQVKALLSGMLSNPVTVNIRKENIPRAVLNSREMQLRLGNYYLKRKDAQKAMEYATTLLGKNPADIAGSVLRGESYILKKNYTSALADFKKALQQHNKRFPGLQEPPEYLLATIDWLEKRQ